MFLHNFKYMFKTLMRDRMLIFWTYAFPILMGTLFYMAFSNIENSEKFDVIDIAIVDNEEFKNDEVLKNSMEILGDIENENQIFNISYVSEDKAKQMLSDEEITGYLQIKDEEASVTVATSGINETIFKSVVEEIVQTADVVEGIVTVKLSSGAAIAEGMNVPIDEEAINKLISDTIEQVQSHEVNIKNVSNDNLSYTMIEFYTLIAMACLYGGVIGMVAINHNLANMSNNGKRLAMIPVSKVKVVLSSMCSGYLIQFIGIVLLFLYTIFVLNVDYGEKLLYIFIIALAGCLAGLTMGIAIGALIKTNENGKIGIIIAVTMLGCFLSGMMGITMKYIIDVNAPIVNIINPAAMITDGLYSLYYYDTLDRFIFDLASLLIFSGVMLVLSFRSLRRVRYDSI